VTNKDWEHRILEHKVAVSDTVQFTCGSASLSCYDPKRGMIYSVYHTSRTSYGESREVFALAIIPVCQPHRTETHIILEHGQELDGVTYTNIIDGNCIFLDGKVRIFFLSGGNQYYYLDFDPKTKIFSKIQPVQCTIDGKTLPLSSAAIGSYLESRKLTGWEFDDPHEQIINTGKMYLHEGWWYGCITSYWCQPVIYRSLDGSCFEILGHVPKVAQYEAQTAIVGGRMYALLRGAEEDNFYISDDLGRSFKPCGRIEFNTTRPQLMPYRGKVLIAVSLRGVKPNLVRDGRNNMKLLLGRGEDLSQYKEIFHITDPYGIVYYDIIDYKGVLYMLWSNADLYIEDIPSYADRPAAKDLLYYAKIGDLGEYIEEELP
jgi:hypothetical protein